MAIQRVCDRCGAVINPKDSGERIIFDLGPGYALGDMDRYDLCVSCCYHLKKWLKGEEQGVISLD